MSSMCPNSTSMPSVNGDKFVNNSSQLFEPAILAGLNLPNRIVRSATHEGMADSEGRAGQRLYDYVADLARGGSGLIISGHCAVQAAGRAGRWQEMIDSDDHIADAAGLADAVHAAGGRIFMQLAHAGAAGIDPASAMGPSPIFRSNDKNTCREMTLEDIAGVVDKFADAAARARQAGFDGIQIHAAHGYLLSQFLSPHYNRRGDAYGGDVSGRSRLTCEVIAAVRKRVGKDYPLIIKVNSEDFIENGLKISDMLEACRGFAAAGLDAVELSGGTLESAPDRTPVRKGLLPPEQEIYYRDAAVAFKRALSLPLILVGGIRSFSTAEQIINDKLADFVALCRPLIREPALPRRWQSGDRSPSTCVSCNLCFRPLLSGKGLCCVPASRKSRTA